VAVAVDRATKGNQSEKKVSHFGHKLLKLDSSSAGEKESCSVGILLK
jgi:hypothetical protein